MKTKILLIDDDYITTFLNKRVVQKDYPEKIVYDFLSASHAINFLKENRDDENVRYIIFLDLNMPEINGWEFLEILEKDFPSLNAQIHILTSSIDQNDRKKASEYNAVHSYIEKPLNRCKLQVVDTDHTGDYSLAAE